MITQDQINSIYTILKTAFDKDIRDCVLNASSFIEKEVNELSLNVLTEQIKGIYFFEKNIFSGIAVLKHDNQIVCVTLVENAPKISVEYPLLIVSYKILKQDLISAFGDKSMLILK